MRTQQSMARQLRREIGGVCISQASAARLRISRRFPENAKARLLPKEVSLMLDASYYAALGLSSIRDKVLEGERLSAADGLALFACPDITAVGALAHHVRCRMHGDVASYVVNRQINYTNVCVNGCVFCAFRRDSEDEPGAFVLSREDVLQRLRAADATPLKLDELHIALVKTEE